MRHWVTRRSAIIGAASVGACVNSEMSVSAEVERFGEEVVSIVDFGAKGDGDSDDSSAFERALRSGAATILVPPARKWYAVGSPIVVQRSGVALRGFGLDSWIRSFAGDKSTIEVISASNVCLTRLRITGGGKKTGIDSGAAIRVDGVKLQESHDIVMSEIDIDGFAGCGLWVGSTLGLDAVGLRFRGAVSSGLDHLGQANDVQISDRCQSIRIERCDFASGGGCAVNVTNRQNVELVDIRIARNTVKGYHLYGIVVYNATAIRQARSSIVVEENNIDGVAGDVPHSQYGFVYGSGIYVQGVDNVIVRGNIVKRTNLGTRRYQLAHGGVAATNLGSIVISDNDISLCAWSGIEVNDPNGLGGWGGGIKLVGNHVSDCRTGILLVDVCSVSLEKNFVRSCREGVRADIGDGGATKLYLSVEDKDGVGMLAGSVDAHNPRIQQRELGVEVAGASEMLVARTEPINGNLVEVLSAEALRIASVRGTFGSAFAETNVEKCRAGFVFRRLFAADAADCVVTECEIGFLLTECGWIRFTGCRALHCRQSVSLSGPVVGVSSYDDIRVLN